MLQNAAPALIAPPYDFEAETSLLGSLLRLSMAGEGTKAMEAVCGLTAGDFYRDAHRVIFETVGEMLMAGVPVAKRGKAKRKGGRA